MANWDEPENPSDATGVNKHGNHVLIVSLEKNVQLTWRCQISTEMTSRIVSRLIHGGTTQVDKAKKYVYFTISSSATFCSGGARNIKHTYPRRVLQHPNISNFELWKPGDYWTNEIELCENHDLKAHSAPQKNDLFGGSKNVSCSKDGVWFVVIFSSSRHDSFVFFLHFFVGIVKKYTNWLMNIHDQYEYIIIHNPTSSWVSKKGTPTK